MAVVPERLRAALRALEPHGPVTAGPGRHTNRTDHTGQATPAGWDQPPDNHDVVRAVVEEARRAGGPIAAAQALALAHHRLLHPALGELRHRIAQDLIAEGSRTRRHGDTLAGLLWRCVDLILDGDGRAARCLTELRGLLAARDEPAVRYVLRAIEVMLEVRAGRFEAAERRAGECAALGAEIGDVDAAAWHTSHLIAIRWYQGRVAELLPAIRRTAASPELSPADHSYQAALVVAAAAAGSRDEALEALAVTCDLVLRDAPRSGSWLVAIYGLVEAAYLLGARHAAARAYDLLLPYSGLPAIAGPAVSCFGSVEHALGLARLTLGDHEGAAAHLRRAVNHNTALGHFPAAVLARHRLAAALAGSPRAEHRDQAHGEAGTARLDADELGMVLPSPSRAAGPADAPGAVAAFDVAVSSVTAPSVTAPSVTAPSVTAPSVTAPGIAAPDVTVGAPACRRQGRHWQVRAAGRSVLVEHCRGMAYLAVLLANPGREIPAYELTTGRGAAVEAAFDATARTGPDDDEIRAYRRRLKILRQEIERCDMVGDQAAGARAHAEHDLLLVRLRAALGLAEGASPATVAEERARVAVGKAIRRALARIAEADPPLGALLSAAVHTGRRCVYLGPQL